MSDVIQRPRVVRGGNGFLDERTATFFVDKAIRAISDDVSRDDTLSTMSNGPVPSLGNDKGRQRFMRRLERDCAAGVATLNVASASEKKRFTFMIDRLGVDGNRVRIERFSALFKRHERPSFKTYVALTISRHALIRLVQRAHIESVEDVFTFLKVIWSGLWLLSLIIRVIGATTPGSRCWLIPVPVGDRTLGLLIRRTSDEEPPALVTVYLDDWYPENMNDTAKELLRALESDMTGEGYDERIATLLPDLLL